MTRRVLILLAALGAAGCTPTYRVHVNTFSQLKQPLGQGASLYVAVDPNSRNPILAARIDGKIRSLLQERGFDIAEKAAGAEYTVTFRAGINATSYLDYYPVSRPFGGYYGGFYGGYYGGFYRGFGFGYTSYVPYIETVYAHWIEMRLYGPGNAGKARGQPVWIGEAVVGMDEPELRRAINYLLVGLMDYFEEDTERWVTVTLKDKDPRILALEEIP